MLRLFGRRQGPSAVRLEPTITCPKCKSEIKLTESLAAPLIEATRLQFEHTIAEKEAQIVKREAAICEQKAAIENARGAIDEQVSEKLKAEREKIIAEEAKKARLILETDIAGAEEATRPVREYLDALDMTTRVKACDKAFGRPRS